MKPLKIHSPDQSESPTTPSQDRMNPVSTNLGSAPPMLTLSTVQLAEFAASIVQQMQLQSAQPANASASTHVEPLKSPSDDHRLNKPVYVARETTTQFTLRDAIDLFLPRIKSDIGPKRIGDFNALLKGWESSSRGRGPDLATLSADVIESVFSGFAAWKSPRIWEKNRILLYQVLKGCCRQSITNRDGIPRGQPAPLDFDSLPIWECPRNSSFYRDRGSAKKTKPRALTDLEVAKIFEACGTTDDPVFWRVLIGFWLVFAMRRDDTFERLSWASATTDGVDVDRSWLCFTPSKMSDRDESIRYDVPIPKSLADGFRALRERRTPLVFAKRNLQRIRDKTLKEICNAAGVTPRLNTDFRASSFTRWRSYRPFSANRFTAHKEKEVGQIHYTLPTDDELREIVNGFPLPPISLEPFTAVRAITPTDTNRTIDTAPNAVS